MKRKIIFGISLAAVIIVLSGLYNLKQISTLGEYQKIKQIHQNIMSMYLEILNNIHSTEVNLYQLKPEHIGDYHIIIDNILESDELISKIRDVYDINKDNATCGNCHDVNQKLTVFIDHLNSNLEALKVVTSQVITSRSSQRMLASRNAAIVSGNDMIIDINTLWLKTLEADTQMQAALELKQRNLEHSIVISVSISFVISLIIIYITLHSITVPIKRLVTGMGIISNGNYDVKVDIVSNDEFGFLAKSFNAMTEELRKSFEERDSLAAELKKLNCSLEERIFQKTKKLREMHENLVRTEGLAIAGTMAANIAHDLSTPLTTIMGYCQLINRKVPEEIGVAPFCNLIENEIERCSQIMKGMLNLVKIPNGERSLVDINKMITEILILVSLQTKCKDITVKDNLSPSIPHIMANNLGLRQACMNIIVNAIEAMPDGGELRISTFVVDSGKNITVSVGDTGQGISEGDMSKIFKTFYTTKKSGTGLGLSISYGIIKALGGDVSVRSEHGKGTTFDISLPVST